MTVLSELTSEELPLYSVVYDHCALYAPLGECGGSRLSRQVITVSDCKSQTYTIDKRHSITTFVIVSSTVSATSLTPSNTPHTYKSSLWCLFHVLWSVTDKHHHSQSPNC